MIQITFKIYRGEDGTLQFKSYKEPIYSVTTSSDIGALEFLDMLKKIESRKQGTTTV